MGAATPPPTRHSACTIESLRVAEAALVAPFKYASYLWAVMYGFLFWGDVPAPGTFLGAALVAGSGLYIFWRERSRGRTDPGA